MGIGSNVMSNLQRGEERIIAYACRQLLQHERNYTSFLIEMQALVLGHGPF
jgi:hypothetical protein